MSKRILCVKPTVEGVFKVAPFTRATLPYRIKKCSRSHRELNKQSSKLSLSLLKMAASRMKLNGLSQSLTGFKLHGIAGFDLYFFSCGRIHPFSGFTANL